MVFSKGRSRCRDGWAVSYNLRVRASIIVPTSRSGLLFEKAIRSAALQTMRACDYEVVVVDAATSGLSERIVRSTWNKMSCSAELRYFRTARRVGLSAAVNHGLHRSRGEYYTILPDDDEMLPEKLKVMCNFLDKRPKQHVAYCLPKYIDANSLEIQTPKKYLHFQRRHPRLSWRHIRMGHGLNVMGTATLYRKDRVREAGLWDTKLPTAEEFEYHLRLLHHGFDFLAVPKVLMCYRLHDGNKSRVFRANRRANWMPYIYKKFFSKKEVERRCVASSSCAPTVIVGPQERVTPLFPNR